MQEYDLKQSQLYSLANNKSKLFWDFGLCECGEAISSKLIKRTDLISAINNKGTIGTIHGIDYYSKCKNCYEREESIRLEKLLGYNNSLYDYKRLEELIQPYKNDDSTGDFIKALSPFEIKLLYQIYQINDFTLIKNSNEIFPVKYGEYKTFVWRTLYKFDNLGLICANKNGSFIIDIEFLENVSALLNHMIGELEPLIEQIDLEMTLLRISDENKTKYFSLLEPEIDIILKAGCKYEFVANVTSDKNIILRVINIPSVRSKSNNIDLHKTDLSDNALC